MADILITGAGGFVGKHLKTALEARGDTVQTISHERLRDPVGLTILETYKVDYIYHLAAYGNMAQHADELEIFNANISNLWNLLQATKTIPYKAFINVSTSSVRLPYQTMYSATKHAGEDLCKAFINEYNKPIVTVRPYSIYGPGEAPHRFIPLVFQSCIEQIKLNYTPYPMHDWYYVTDFVNKMIEIAQNIDKYKKKSIHVVECGTGIEHSNQEVVAFVEQITCQRANAIGDGTPRRFDATHWVAPYYDPDTTNLVAGLKNYYDWYRAYNKDEPMPRGK